MSASLEERLAGVRGASAGEARSAIEELLSALERGVVRAAEPDAEAAGGWRVVPWVKQGILAAFALGRDVDIAGANSGFRDRDTLLPRRQLPPGIRLVPGGSAVRRGAFLGSGVVIMPPAYVNVGAWVGERTMIDSHALVGSCAQIGCGVHLSAGAQIGGVLEPIGARPVIVEDDVFVGGLTGLYEGVVVRRRAVVGAGVVLTGSTPVYDLVDDRVLCGSPGAPLEIPEGAVVVMGSRPAAGAFAREHRLNLATPVIVKRRDGATDAKTVLEEVLR